MRLSDRRAIVFIFAVVLAFWGGIIVERRLSRVGEEPVSIDEAATNTMDSAFSDDFSSRNDLPDNSGRSHLSDEAMETTDVVKNVETFAFDPNTADSATLLRLGFAPWQVRNIIKYRARGGRYRRVEDLKRLYGMTPELYERLAPYVKIDKRFQPYSEEELNADDVRSGGQDSSKLRYPRQEKFKELVQLDLNSVDTTTLKMVPGIASYRARQIVRYRDRLGGFVSIDQLSEIEGFPADELSVWFKVETGVTKRININKAAVPEMGRHPYIGFARARAIADYRRKQGHINSLADLQLLTGFGSDDIVRIEPYIEY